MSLMNDIGTKIGAEFKSHRLRMDEIENMSSNIKTVPFGAIMPIASNLTGSHAIPASGAVDADGWMYCNGAAIPAGKVVSGTTPNLTDGRFLRGSTSSGSVSGSDTFTLAEANLPAHTHTTPNHTHTGSTNTTGSHTHSTTLARRNGAAVISYGWSNRGNNDGNLTVNTSSSGSHSHTLTINSGGAGTTSSVGSGTAVTHIPKYVNVQYLIKVN